MHETVTDALLTGNTTRPMPSPAIIPACRRRLTSMESLLMYYNTPTLNPPMRNPFLADSLSEFIVLQ